MYKINKFDLPNMRDDGSIKITEKYTIAEYEPRGLRLEELAIRLCSEISTYFILYDYKGTISTDNDEVLELLKEKYRSGDYEAHSSKNDFHGDNLTIFYDEILVYQPDGKYKWVKYIPKWSTVYRKLAIKLLNLSKNPFKKEKLIGNTLYELCFQDEAFKNKNEWIIKFSLEFNVECLDPIHIFASLNSITLGNQTRIDRINILFRLLDKNAEKYLNIDFSGCPTPPTIRMIGARGEDDQKEVWNTFFEVMEKSQKSRIDFGVVKNWYGIDIVSFTIFLFWIDSKNFLPLDKYTINLLEKYDKFKILPNTYAEYRNLTAKSNTDLYRNLALIAYDNSKQDFLSDQQREELMGYLNSKDTFVLIEPIVTKTIISNPLTIYSSNNALSLIALKPLSGCDKDYLKTLKEDENYIFDKAYDFESDDKIVVNKEIALSLYDIRDLKINIHAIVGKNGTGKSTLVELLFAIINNLACKKIVNNDLKPISFLKAELIFEHVELYKIVVDNDNISIYQYEKQENNYINPRLMSIDEFDLNHLFYTIAVNYSQHSLNSLHLGTWLNALFHKNDAYQTPIVIEPFRKDGNVDINRQSDLVKQRLLANLLEFEVWNDPLNVDIF